MALTTHGKIAHKRARSRRTGMRPASAAYGKASNAKKGTIQAGKNALMIKLEKRYMLTLRPRGKMVLRVLEVLAKAAEKAKQSGDAVALTIRVTPRTAEPAITSAVVKHDALEGALIDARARGAQRVAEILKGQDMLSGREFALLIGTSPETVNQKRKVGELLGLEGAARGVRFPKWQITDDGRPLPGLKSVFEILGDDPWTVYRFLTQRHNELAGASALDAMKSGHLEDVRNVARNLKAGVFA
jgi:hypothetical protein